MLDENRIKYYDALKVLAIIGVISLHIFQIWWGKPILKLDLFYAVSEVSRFGVPLFLMVTGALLLNRDIELVSFFKKKWIRLCYPFIFYLIIHLLIIPIDINILGYNWYFWMILCVYLAIPIINKFIVNSSIRELEYYIIVIVISSVIYQLLNFVNVENYIDLNFFMGPLCFVVLGYYLSIKDFKLSDNKIITICIFLFVLSTIIKIIGCLHIVPIELTMNFKATNSEILTSWVDVGIFELIQASSLFILVKYIYKCSNGTYAHVRSFLERKNVNKFIISVSKASYGMYLVNRTLMLFCDYNIKDLPLTGKQKIICFIILNISIFFISWLIVVVLSRIPVLKKFSGYA